ACDLPGVLLYYNRRRLFEANPGRARPRRASAGASVGSGRGRQRGLLRGSKRARGDGPIETKRLATGFGRGPFGAAHAPIAVATLVLHLVYGATPGLLMDRGRK
ncbi:MAG: hypothetical protein CYG60_03990, partial [Actinobacteria bacterium]